MAKVNPKKKIKPAIKETDLYAPIKRLLEGQGYEVKSEVGPADVVACREGEEPVIVELKTGFSLSLFHQAVERQAISDTVYIAVPRGSGQPFLSSLSRNTALCRRLGVGLITVRLRDKFVEVHCDPAPYRPRKSPRRSGRLLREFAKRVGDPNTGGATRKGLMTAYRQDALKCLQVLAENGPTKAALVSKATGVPTARRLMADDHYGWFERVPDAGIGVYGLTPKGVTAICEYAEAIAVLTGHAPTESPEAEQKPRAKAHAKARSRRRAGPRSGACVKTGQGERPLAA